MQPKPGNARLRTRRHKLPTLPRRSKLRARLARLMLRITGHDHGELGKLLRAHLCQLDREIKTGDPRTRSKRDAHCRAAAPAAAPFTWKAITPATGVARTFGISERTLDRAASKLKAKEASNHEAILNRRLAGGRLAVTDQKAVISLSGFLKWGSYDRLESPEDSSLCSRERARDFFSMCGQPGFFS